MFQTPIQFGSFQQAAARQAPDPVAPSLPNAQAKTHAKRRPSTGGKATGKQPEGLEAANTTALSTTELDSFKKTARTWPTSQQSVLHNSLRSCCNLAVHVPQAQA